jgi:hypothetical protein
MTSGLRSDDISVSNAGAARTHAYGRASNPMVPATTLRRRTT